MREVIYTGPYTAVTLPDNTVCEMGKPVSVSDEIAENLIRQGFKPVGNSKEGK